MVGSALVEKHGNACHILNLLAPQSPHSSVELPPSPVILPVTMRIQFRNICTAHGVLAKEAVQADHIMSRNTKSAKAPDLRTINSEKS